VRYLNWNGDRWNWNFNWLDNDFNDNNPAAVPAILFISLPLCWESFVVEAGRRTWACFLMAILKSFRKS